MKVILLRLSREETEILTKYTISPLTNLDHNSSHVPSMYITLSMYDTHSYFAIKTMNGKAKYTILECRVISSHYNYILFLFSSP